MDTQFIGGIWEAWWNQVEYVGQTGIAAWGLAAIDIALWDILAPLPMYPTAALWLTDFLLAEDLRLAYEAWRDAEANVARPRLSAAPARRGKDKDTQARSLLR